MVPYFAVYRSFPQPRVTGRSGASVASFNRFRSEEHTSELQSLAYLVCRLLLEKKKPGTLASRDQVNLSDDRVLITVRDIIVNDGHVCRLFLALSPEPLDSARSRSAHFPPIAPS